MDEEKRDDMQHSQDTQPETVDPIEPQPDMMQDAIPEEKSMGPVLGSIIIVIIIVITAFYIWGSGAQNDAVDTPVAGEHEEHTDEEPHDDGMMADENTAPVAPVDEATEALADQGTSDDIAAIEADLDATILDGLDAELEAIEAELQ